MTRPSSHVFAYLSVLSRGFPISHAFTKFLDRADTGTYNATIRAAESDGDALPPVDPYAISLAQSPSSMATPRDNAAKGGPRA